MTRVCLDCGAFDRARPCVACGSAALLLVELLVDARGIRFALGAPPPRIDLSLSPTLLAGLAEALAVTIGDRATRCRAAAALPFLDEDEDGTYWALRA